HVDAQDLEGLDPARYPNLTQFLATSTRFTDYRAEGRDDMANLASMLTGLDPEEHGAGAQGTGWTALAPAHTSLPKYLIEHTYNPGAVMAGAPFLDPQYGLNQGFREYEWIPGDASELAALGVDWIEHHYKQPFFYFVELPLSETDAPLDLDGADAALGILLRSMGSLGLLDQACIALTALGPRTASADGTLPLCIKAPLQQASAIDGRAVRQVHLPILLLQYAALPVAAVRPGAYLKHPLPPAVVSAQDATPQ
ncbi:MAG TPA: hypothetical protein P5218_14455, partial [Planctomycetota bacterium]|nr:hypothetical protein [Planctomycetota bacterium]